MQSPRSVCAVLVPLHEGNMGARNWDTALAGPKRNKIPGRPKYRPEITTFPVHGHGQSGRGGEEQGDNDRSIAERVGMQIWGIQAWFITSCCWYLIWHYRGDSRV